MVEVRGGRRGLKGIEGGEGREEKVEGGWMRRRKGREGGGG